MLKDFIHIFVLSCRKATFLIEKRLHVPLSLVEKWQLKLHLRLCKFCTAYEEKAVFLDSVMKQEAEKELGRCRFQTKEVEAFREKLKGDMQRKEERKD